MPKVTICIPVYNGAEFLSEALESIKQQTFTDYIVVVSDNASQDDTSKIIDKWAEQLPIHRIRQSHTIPIGDHFNCLLDNVRTLYYLVLCHDDYLASPNALQDAVLALDTNEDASAVYCDMLYVDICRRVLSKRNFGRSGKIPADDLGKASIRSARNLFGIPLLIRTSALGQLRYDTRLTYLGDLDLSWRLSSGGFIFHIPRTYIANRFTGVNTTWKLLRSSELQFRLLAEKHQLNIVGWPSLRLRLTNFAVSLQKRVFNLYARCRSAL